MENLQKTGIAYLISAGDRTMLTLTSVHEVALWILHHCSSEDMQEFAVGESFHPANLYAKDSDDELLIPYRTVDDVRNELFYLLSL